MNLKNLEEKILNIDSSNINESDIKGVEEAVAALDRGEIRVAEESNGEWIINAVSYTHLTLPTILLV